MIIYRYSSNNIYTGESTSIPDNAGVPRGWTSSPIPGNIPSGHSAVYTGIGWEVRETSSIITSNTVIVPTTVTRRQARQALLLAGLLNNVQPAIDAIPDATQRGLMQIEWEDSQTFDRYRPTLVSLASALGLSSQDLDNLFITAATL